MGLRGWSEWVTDGGGNNFFDCGESRKDFANAILPQGPAARPAARCAQPAGAGPVVDQMADFIGD